MTPPTKGELRTTYCMFCARPLCSAFQGESEAEIVQVAWLEGTADLITPGFGSRYDLEPHVIVICDDCIETHLMPYMRKDAPHEEGPADSL